jgi:hypothetical protein
MKVATFSADHKEAVAYTLCLTTFFFDRVGDGFGSLFALATGVQDEKPCSAALACVSILVGVLFFLRTSGSAAPFTAQSTRRGRQSFERLIAWSRVDRVETWPLATHAGQEGG